MKNFESEIIMAYKDKNFESIREMYVEMLNTRSKLDRWFNKYLDMFDEKFSTMDRNDPAKKLYFAKYDEYTELNKTIKIAEHFMNHA